MKRKSVWIIAVVALFLAGLGVALVRLGVQERRAANQLWKEYADGLRAAGEPVTMADVERLRPVVPPEVNGALIIEGLVKELGQLDDDDTAGVAFFDESLRKRKAWTEVLGVPLGPSRTFLASHAAVLKSLQGLAKSEGGRLTVSYDTGKDNPSEIMLPSIREWRQASRLLQLETLIAAHDNELARAVEAIGLQGKLAATLQAEPNLISRLVQIAIDNETVDSLEGLMRLSRLDGQRTQMLERVVACRLMQSSLKASFFLERAYFLTICNGLAERRIEWSDVSGEEQFRMSLPQIRRNQVDGAKWYDELVDAADEQTAVLSVVRRIDSDMVEAAGSMSKRWGSHRIVLTLMPSFGRAVEIHLSCIARLRCAQIGLAADRFHQERGRFPVGGEELVPDYLQSVPVDPFSNSPLRFVETKDGLVVYSIGEKLVDDGGSR
ncbi:MAG: hypothetical protein IID36_10245, partial [Planctomycetes bacterium]|nr:hypothetical protein [Planctomycetota bacterium]